MIILAIDTASTLCAACILDTEKGELSRKVLDLGKGHAEHLMGVIEDVLAAAGLAHRDLEAIAVSVGPGSFTGVRVGVATARGLALALKIPAIGISSLEALAAEARAAHPNLRVLAAITAGRGQVYAALYDGGGAGVRGPQAIMEEEIDEWDSEAELITGSAAALAQAVQPFVHAPQATTADIAIYARLGAEGLRDRELPARPAPLYLRSADAKVQQGFALPRREGAS
jgi:tRNA threonylcarbamoyladenosine biosynthesis protein TsaB